MEGEGGVRDSGDSSVYDEGVINKSKGVINRDSKYWGVNHTDSRYEGVNQYGSK
ncbi:hypothetical protein CWI38_2711p0020 [Hamiltosporidium tvaerminnensis]|uniref:Uncharacterized protein n=2 Tax=Hamiltosporidium TaxID=1176354 RepID=A0A4Q9LD00_9MICR|nr:hypothetical protein CWI37_1523p0020 [Hamiltosporidium tvaerminnensis]TBU02012.1 hypothetical protein CWI39_1254p0020 [Hamiltosporidium magnivora]TBU05758.1 hypothetical protein CWI38_2711p0020 [Hamiltosporidium tvaerminnensis]